jgi:hypothetical protein
LVHRFGNPTKPFQFFKGAPRHRSDFVIAFDGLVVSDVNVVTQENSRAFGAQGGSNTSQPDEFALQTGFLRKFSERSFLRTFVGLDVPFGEAPLAFVASVSLLNEENFPVLHDP